MDELTLQARKEQDQTTREKEYLQVGVRECACVPFACPLSREA